MARWNEIKDMDVFRNETQFDYSKWDGKSSLIKFLSVPWDASKNIVNWASESYRNNYFTTRQGFYIDLGRTEFNLESLDEGDILVDIPRAAVNELNYLYVDLYSEPIPGYNEDYRRTRLFYFVTDAKRESPSAVKVHLKLDVWTTYRNSVEFNSINLKRGHHPLAMISADQYLANPLSNSYGLTELEPDMPTLKPLVSFEKFMSFSKANPRVLIATTADLANLDSAWLNTQDLDNVHHDANISIPVEYWADRGVDSTKTSLGHFGQAAVPPVAAPKVPSLRAFSVDVSRYGAFITFLRRRYPQIVKTIKMVCVFDAELVDEGPEFSLSNFKLKTVTEQKNAHLLEELKLSKELFGYDPRYADIAKLYTSQFATIEVSNMNGKKVEITLEDIEEGLEFWSRASAVVPFIKLEAFIHGIGGNDSRTYAVKPWNNATAQLFKSSWQDFTLELEVPTYGVFAESREILGAQAEIERFKARLAADLKKDIAKLEADTESFNKTGLLETSNQNTKNKIYLDFLNSSDSVTLDFSNTNRGIATTSYSGALAITRDLNNRRNDAETGYSNAQDELNSNFDRDSRSISNEKSVATTMNWMQKDKSMADLYAGTADFNARRLVYEDVRYLEQRMTYDPILGRGYRDYDFYEFKKVLEKDRLEAMKDLSNFAAIGGQYEIAEMAKVGMFGQASELFGIGAVGSYSASNASNNSSGSTNSGSGTGLAPSTLTAIGGTLIGAGQEALLKNVRQAMTVSRNLLKNGFPGEDRISVGYSFDDGSSYSYSGRSVVDLELAAHQELEGEDVQRTWDSIQNITNNLLGLYGDLTQIEKGIKTQVYNANNYKANKNAALFDGEVTGKINPNYDAGVYGITRVRDAKATIASRTKQNVYVTAERTRAADTAALNYRVANDTTSNDFTKTVGNTIARRTRTVSDTINDARVVSEQVVIARNYNTAILEMNKEYDAAIAQLTADYNELLFSEPLVFGEDSGDGAIDAWGLRGLDITVKRISKGDERRIGETFLRTGYRTGGMWVDNPRFDIMTHYSYWEGDDVMISGTKANETIKEKLRNIFAEGVRIWNSPEIVAQDDIANNMRRVL
jgi:hypothetical protein